MENNVEEFVKWIRNSDNIVFFGGAGVSTESGIPDLEVLIDYIIRSINIRRRQFLVTAFI